MKTLRQITNSMDICETNTTRVHRPTQGNYFVMDSEQVVSNPYQDLQQEALDATKKVSLTERLTTVRNNVAEHYLRTEASHIEKQRKHSMRNLHMDSSNLRYQNKVMDIHKRRNDLMMQQRIEPEKDYAYDTRQINNTAKRLGVTDEKSFYLHKDLKYPLRGTIIKDHNAKPFIKKARRTMQDRCTQKKIERHEMERIHTANTFERTPTAQSLSTSIEIPSPEPSIKGPRMTQIPTPEPSTKGPRMTPLGGHSGTLGGRQQGSRTGSKSAPLRKSTGDLTRSGPRKSITDETDGKLPSITVTGSHSGANIRPATKSHVKFEDQNLRQSAQNGLQRSKTFTSGETRPTRTYQRREAWDSDSDDDYLYCDKVDLRALFFGDKSQNGENKSGGASRTTTPRNSVTRMSLEIPPMPRSKSAQPIKQEHLIKEAQEIRHKIDKFLDTLPAEEKYFKKEDTGEEKIEEKKDDKEEKKERENAVSKMSVAAKAAYLLSVFSKPVDRKMMWGGPMYRPSQHQENANANQQADTNDKNDEDDTPRKKEMWELIKTNVQNGNIREKYSANDLLLQQLTGILVRSDRKTSIPIHSASRALRHTPTFKMRRVVEELMRQRTRYEQQEIDKLQQEGESVDDQNGDVFEDRPESPGGVQHYPAPV